MNKNQKKNLIRIAASAVLILVVGQLGLQGLPRLIAYLVPYLIVGYDILYKAGRGVVRRQPLDECLLMAVATLGALALAIYEDGDYTEAIAVMLFYQVGEWFQSYAIGKSRRDITELMDIRPDYANVAGENGALQRVDPDEVAVGTVITVQPGEKIPIDGVVVSGASALNTVALTGESLPRDVAAGDEVLSGCINVSGLLRIRTTKEFDESTASKILELVEDASSRKSRGAVHHAVRARLYAGRRRRCRRAHHPAAARARPRARRGAGVGHMALPRAHVPRRELPLRARHQHSALVLRRARRREPRGRSREGIELPRGTRGCHVSRL